MAPCLPSLPRLPWCSPRSRGGCHSTQDEQRADPASGQVLRARHGRGEGMLLAGGCRSIPPPLRGVLAQPLAGLLWPRSSTSCRSKMPGSPPGAMPRAVPTSLSLARSTSRGHGRAGAAFALGWTGRKQGFPSLQVFLLLAPFPTTSSPVAVISAAAPLGAVPEAWLSPYHCGAAAPPAALGTVG